jgi:hypothetical protein
VQSRLLRPLLKADKPAAPGDLVAPWPPSSVLSTTTSRTRVLELAIWDLREGSGLSHCPSGSFGANGANGAWVVCVTIAHNLIRWLGALVARDPRSPVSKTIRRQFLSLLGRITCRARRGQLYVPTN